MQKQIQKATFILLSSLLLSGCGGGGGDSASEPASTPSTTSSVQKTTTVTTSSTSSSSSTVLSRTGSIVDASGIEGLRVKCGTQETLSTTDGLFSCTNFPMDVYLGDFKLGSVQKLPLDKMVYTQDLLNIARGATTHPSATKISMLLQSLDSDSQVSNGIKISSDTLSIVNSYLSAYSKIEDISFEDLEYLIEDVVRESQTQNANSNLAFVNSSTAQNNLTTMTAQTAPLTYEQRSIGRIK